MKCRHGDGDLAGDKNSHCFREYKGRKNTGRKRRGRADVDSGFEILDRYPDESWRSDDLARMTDESRQVNHEGIIGSYARVM